jgi:exosome complex component RRP45
VFDHGHVETALGNTLIISQIQSQLVTPFSDRPFEGFIEFEVDFLPMAHVNFENLLGYNVKDYHRRQRNELSNSIERMLEKVIKRSKAINTESLCIL